MQLLAKVHSWWTVQLYFKEGKEARSIYNCIIWNKNFKTWLFLKNRSKKNIFKEPRSLFGVSSFLCEYILTHQTPQKSSKNLSVIIYKKFLFKHHQFHFFPSKTFFNRHKLSLRFSLKYRLSFLEILCKDRHLAWPLIVVFRTLFFISSIK